MFDELIFATHNRDKVTEVAKMFAGLGVKIRCLADFPDVVPAEETGRTLAENAILKAAAAVRQLGKPAFSDDTGLFIASLAGRPGIHAARYAGENASYQDNIEKVISELEGIPNDRRRAEFRTVVAFLVPEGQRLRLPRDIRIVDGDDYRGATFTGVLEGRIALESAGDGGFGYDPIFYVPSERKTLAQISLEKKNKISHRARAMGKFVRAVELLNTKKKR